MNEAWQSDTEHCYGMEPWADEAYREIYGTKLDKIITLTPKGHKPHVLDQYFGIDRVLKFTNGMILTVQEKFRHIEFIKFGDFTLENKSNNRGAPGELEHLCADLYFYGYGESDEGFALAYMFKVFEVKTDIINQKLIGFPGQNKDHSTASFIGYPWHNFNPNHIIYHKRNY